MPQTAEKIAFLRQTAREIPEYRDIMPLFLELFSAIEGREAQTGITFSLPSAHAAERVAAGMPLVTPERMTVHQPVATAFLVAVVDALLRAGKEGGDELELLRDALTSGKLELAPVFAGCLSRDRKVLDDAAAELGISSPLLEFALEPVLKTALELCAEGVAPAQVAGWQEGYCPVCGSRAGMAELAGEEGKRLLSCSSCFFQWPYKRMKCPYCSNEDAEQLSYFLVGDGPTRVDICQKCSRYLKTRDTRLGHAGVPLEAEDLATIHLDLAAGREGFERGA